jgi:mannose-6-phosphate isomerase-like protein (cupin superfamily)
MEDTIAHSSTKCKSGYRWICRLGERTENEFFYVVEGRFFIDPESRTVELMPRQGLMVPRGVMHRTRAPERTVVLMIEEATVIPTGT